MKRARFPHLDDDGKRMLITRQSLIERLVNWEDQRKWQEFFDAYWRLIHGVARKSGLSESEAQDVVQETVLTVAKNITKYDREAGSFKGWLLHITRWRITDQFRKRAPEDRPREVSGDSTQGTATIERFPDPAGGHFETLWDREWQKNLFEAALERVKRRVDAKQYQIFDCAVVKHWPATKVAAELGVNIAQVYLAKHRVMVQVKKEVAALDQRDR